jgi:glycosyltransferase involved in cell wall biosynthesis
MRAAEGWKLRQREPRPVTRIGWVSSWNTRCGIAGYSAYLLQHFESEVSVYASHRTPEEELDKWLLPADGPEIRRCWQSGFGDQLNVLTDTMLDDLPEVVVIQFNYGFFEFAALTELIKMLKRHRVTVAVMFHSTFDPPELPERRLEILSDALSMCDRLLVHSPEDLNRLKSIGLTHNTTLLPHGVMAAKGGAPGEQPEKHPGLTKAHAPLRIASFGFLLPHKGLEELLEALALVRQRGADVCLHMLNAEYPAAVSREAIAAITEKIKQLGLEAAVTLDTIYYTDDECLERLARAHLVVFPYQATQESSSAAVRHAIASGVPVAVTPLPIFEDVRPAVIELPGTEPEAIATGLLELIDWTDADWDQHTSQARAWRAQHSHQVIARRLEGMLQALAAGL